MSSFTPFYNPSLQIYSTNFYPWISLESWNQNSFMLLAMKKQQASQTQNSPLFFGQKKVASSTQFSPIEEDYQPERQNQCFGVQAKKNRGRIQCRGRNDYSNILKAFIHLIKTNSVLKDNIKSIINKKGLPLTYERFLMRIRRKFSKGKTYISPKQILRFIKSCNQMNDQSQKAIGLMLRIILKNFLSIEYVLCLIKSFKGKKQTRKDLITKTRQLFNIIFEEGSVEDHN